jgi:hypothetical protein
VENRAWVKAHYLFLFAAKAFTSAHLLFYGFNEEMLGALNNKMRVGGISYDLTEAFYYVNHELLLS